MVKEGGLDLDGVLGLCCLSDETDPPFASDKRRRALLGQFAPGWTCRQEQP